jgi:hypothetical protein
MNRNKRILTARDKGDQPVFLLLALPFIFSCSIILACMHVTISMHKNIIHGTIEINVANERLQALGLPGAVISFLDRKSGGCCL